MIRYKKEIKNDDIYIYIYIYIYICCICYSCEKDVKLFFT
jgi:hypothetical protein